MNTILLQITALEPLVLSDRSATAGDHHSLDFIPGRLLLGICAQRYADFREHAYAIFHRGDVCFGDALPCLQGQIAVPTPAVLQHQKLNPAAILNLAAASAELKVQHSNLSTPYVCLHDHAFSPAKVLTSRHTKTAIEPDGQNRAQESALFSYEGIQPGQQFIAALDISPELPSPITQQLLDALLGDRFMGRSRSAQFGRVRIEQLTQPLEALLGVARAAAPRTSVSVLLLSDLLLYDDSGLTRQQPRAVDLGLPATWQLQPERSSARACTDDRFNGYRRSYDLQRQLITRGSVYTFAGPEHTIVTGPSRVGEDRHEGLGWILTDAPLLRVKSPSLKEPYTPYTPQTSTSSPPSQMLEWIKQRQRSRATIEPSILDGACLTLIKALRTQNFPISPSQWSNLHEWARTTPTQALSEESWRERVGGTSGQWSRGWEVLLKLSADENFGQHVVQFGQTHGSQALASLAKRVRSLIIQEQNTTHPRSNA